MLYATAFILAVLTVVACTEKKAAPIIVPPVVLQAPAPQVQAPIAATPAVPQAPATYSQLPITATQPYYNYAPPAPTQFYQTVDPEPTGSGGILGFLQDNWLALLFGFLGFVEVVIRLTPTETDNSIFNIIKRLLDAWFPNVNKAGGNF